LRGGEYDPCLHNRFSKPLRIFSENFIAAVVSGWTFHEKSQLIGQ
jgi:hypothetical protein